MKTFLALLAKVLCFAFLTAPIHAQVPQLLNYQGRVAVGGANFEGTGSFKFALLNPLGVLLWSNDGTTGVNTEPAAAVSLPVSKGLYSVLLGDTTLANMTAIPASVFQVGNVRLRVWFNDGTHGSQLLSPDQRIDAAGYAMMAGAVSNGAITSAKFASGAVGAAQIAGGAVGTTQLASGAVTSANLAAGAVGATHLGAGAAAASLSASGLSAVPSGGVVLAPASGEASLRSLGYVKLGLLNLLATWEPGSVRGRASHTAVWTGSEMIVWGGFYSTILLNDGARYNPATDTWTMVTTTAAPAARADHTAVWTGSEMIVWGGSAFGGAYNVLYTGGRYNPATNTWTPTTLTFVAAARYGHTAVWTGSEMIVWGGLDGSGYMNIGGRYNPATNAWRSMNIVTAPFRRAFHTAVWTGSEMIIWGGDSDQGYPLNGSRYNPATNLWTPVTLAGSPFARDFHTAVWTGSEMIVWGGNEAGLIGNDGGRYNPATNTWAAVTTTGAPSARQRHSAVWTGSEMIVWGGGYPTYDGTGGRYNPASDTWAAVTTTGAPAGRQAPAIWTGSEMIVWGGEGQGFPGIFDDGGRYNPGSNTWRPFALVGAPAARYGHTAAWTGSEMIVWGGSTGNSSELVNAGARYIPSARIWLPAESIGQPSARQYHTAVWTGSEMIVWGGTDVNGGRYIPATDTWAPLESIGQPSARQQHTAVWTGSEMIVWGGFDASSFTYLGDGGRYNAAGHNWTAVTLNNAPVARYLHTAVWTGNEMIVWGGGGGGAPLRTGGRYNPVANTWTSSTLVGAPIGREQHSAVWTGSEMIVWGGYSSGTVLLNDGGRYNPTDNSWTALTTTGAPDGRYLHTAVWTGREMIVWGGYTYAGGGGGTYLGTGGRYNPTANLWTAVSNSGAPSARRQHTAVWTGKEMIVWGGLGKLNQYYDQTLNDTFSYFPGSDLFFFQSP